MASEENIYSIIEKIIDQNAIAFSEWMDSEEYENYIHDFKIAGLPTDNKSMYLIYKQKCQTN